MIERWGREGEREREKGRRRDIVREGEIRERERWKGYKEREWNQEDREEEKISTSITHKISRMAIC